MISKKRFVFLCKRFFLVAAALVLMSLGINLYIIFSTKTSVIGKTENLPEYDFALILGTDAMRSDGSTNLHFLNRTEAAAQIYLSGKVRHLLISGNQNNRGFNEVLEMKKCILKENVPDTAIELDFAGNRTWESIRRAKEMYRLKKLIVVTDDFHAARALFLCRHFGIEAVAFCPKNNPFDYWSVRYSVREYFARMKAVSDIVGAFLTRDQPAEMGTP